MNNFLNLLFLVLFAACSTDYHSSESDFPIDIELSLEDYELPVLKKSAEGHFASLHSTSDKRNIESKPQLPSLDKKTRQALLKQLHLLQKQNKSRSYKIGNKIFKRQDFINVIEDLLQEDFSRNNLSAIAISNDFNVRFTGYYSPEIRVSKKKTKKYKYPILRKPKNFKGKLPNRKAIEKDDALGADSLAIAWASHPLDVYNLQLQGSGFITYTNGKKAYLAYGGTNRYPYQSIELALEKMDSTVTDLSKEGLRQWMDSDLNKRDSLTWSNPNYGFFVESTGKAKGAAGIDLTPMISVAADPRHYPLGSVLLANLPKSNNSKEIVPTLLLVQDTGGAVKGSKHLDLYTGIGQKALNKAERTALVSEVYMLLPM